MATLGQVINAWTSCLDISILADIAMTSDLCWIAKHGFNTTTVRPTSSAITLFTAVRNRKKSTPSFAGVMLYER